MRKLLVALMIVAFAATAFAEIKISGHYNVNGIYKSNLSAVDNDSDDKNMFYEQEWKLKVNAQTDKDTYFKSKLEISDNTWNKSVDYPGATSFQVERAYMGHNFGAVKLDVGLMDGGAWSYAFGNNKEGYYRVKATIPAAGGKVLLISQKNKEANESAVYDDAEKDDSDSYIVAYSGKLGGISFAPLAMYIVDGTVEAADGDVDKTTVVLDLGLGGNFGAVGFEFEAKYYSIDPENGDTMNPYGLFANVFGKVGSAKVGFYSAYASSSDEDGTFNMADDFDDTYAGLQVLGEEGGWVGGDIKGAWANALYAETAINDKLNMGAAFAYLTSNYESGVMEDATAYEFDVTASYAITKELSYDVLLGYAKVDLDGGTDPDASYIVKHGLTLSF